MSSRRPLDERWRHQEEGARVLRLPETVIRPLPLPSPTSMTSRSYPALHPCQYSCALALMLSPPTSITSRSCSSDKKSRSGIYQAVLRPSPLDHPSRTIPT